MANKKILIIAPHQDDEVLGCGGIMAKNIAEGNEVYVCSVTCGYPPIFPNVAQSANDRQDTINCHRFLGIKETFFLDLPAANLESVKRYEFNKMLLDVVQKIHPEEVYIPHRGDMQLDHQLVADAAMVALRPKYFPQVKKILAYETLSETDWNIPNVSNAFIPNVFENIEGFLNIKIEALSYFKSQIGDFPDPRSLEAVEALAKFRGAQMFWKAAEAFMLVRELNL